MAVDLEAIRKRVAQLNGDRKNSSIQLWKPGVGEYKIRGLPCKNAKEGLPFIERWFYYFVNPGILTPKQFGKPDPIDDLIRKLFSTKNPDDRNVAKKMLPKMRAFMPIIVRGEENKGVQFWSFGTPIYKRLLGFFSEEDVGDFLDPETGCDLKVAVTHQPGKMFNGKPSFDTVVDYRRASKLSDNPELAKQWLDSIPNIDDMYKLKSTAEIEHILTNWMNGGQSSSADEGTLRDSSSSSDALDEIASELKGEKVNAKPAAAKVEKPVKAKPKKADPTVDDEPSTTKKTIDDAFAELMDDEDN